MLSGRSKNMSGNLFKCSEKSQKMNIPQDIFQYGTLLQIYFANLVNRWLWYKVGSSIKKVLTNEHKMYKMFGEHSKNNCHHQHMQFFT